MLLMLEKYQVELLLFIGIGGGVLFVYIKSFSIKKSRSSILAEGMCRRCLSAGYLEFGEHGY